MKKQLTIEQAYKAMFYFLENEYKSTEIDEIGGLLGSLSWKIFSDSQPANPGLPQYRQPLLPKQINLVLYL